MKAPPNPALEPSRRLSVLPWRAAQRESLGRHSQTSMIEIRPSSPDDFGDVLGLLEQLWPGRRLDVEGVRHVYMAAISSDSHLYLSACQEGRVVGFASLSILASLRTAGRFGHVDELVVDSALRGCGIGGRLLDAVQAEARMRGCSRLELNSGIQRTASHKFYEVRGFERRAFHFFGPPLTEE